MGNHLGIAEFLEGKLENATNITMDEIIESFQSIIIVTGVDKDDMLIGTETNEDGQIVRVFVILNDKDTANKVKKTIDEATRDCKKKPKDKRSVSTGIFLIHKQL